MHDEFLNQRHGTFFFIAILDGIFLLFRYLLAETEKSTLESLPRKSKEAYENLHTLLHNWKKKRVT
jgi:hypothetical protein